MPTVSWHVFCPQVRGEIVHPSWLCSWHFGDFAPCACRDKLLPIGWSCIKSLSFLAQTRAADATVFKNTSLNESVEKAFQLVSGPTARTCDLKRRAPEPTPHGKTAWAPSSVGDWTQQVSEVRRRSDLTSGIYPHKDPVDMDLITTVRT